MYHAIVTTLAASGTGQIAIDTHSTSSKPLYFVEATSFAHVPLGARKMGGILLMTEESTRSLQLKLRECCLGKTSAKLASAFAGRLTCYAALPCAVEFGAAICIGS